MTDFANASRAHAYGFNKRVQSTRVASSDITLKQDVMNVHYKSGTFSVWGRRRGVDTHLRNAIFIISP